MVMPLLDGKMTLHPWVKVTLGVVALLLLACGLWLAGVFA